MSKSLDQIVAVCEVLWWEGTEPEEKRRSFVREGRATPCTF